MRRFKADCSCDEMPGSFAGAAGAGPSSSAAAGGPGEDEGEEEEEDYEDSEGAGLSRVTVSACDQGWQSCEDDCGS